MNSTGWTLLLRSLLVVTITVTSYFSFALGEDIVPFRVTDSFKSSQSDKKVYLVRDLTVDEIGQMKLAQTLDLILAKENIRLICVPAAAGDVSLSLFRQRIPSGPRTKTASDYVQKGRLSTVEYLELTTEKDLKVWGIESTELYEHALKTAVRLLRRSRLLEGPTSKPVRPGTMKSIERLQAQFKEESDLQVRLSVEHLAQAFQKNKETTTLLLVPGLSLERWMEELKQTDISYEVLTTDIPHNPDEIQFERRLYQEAGLPAPADYKASAWKSGFLRDAPLALRPAREALTFTLLRDQRPVLWDLGASMGLMPADNLQVILNSMSASSEGVLKKDESPIHFSWTEGLFPSAMAAGVPAQEKMLMFWQQEALMQIERDYDRHKYGAFKELARKMEEVRRIEDEKTLSPLIVEYIRTYEKALGEAEKKKDDQKKGLLQIPWVQRLVAGYQNFIQGIPSHYRVRPMEMKKVTAFLRHNVTAGGMPLSYKAPKGFWTDLDSGMDEVDSAMERLLVEHSVSIYDAALWQIGLSLTGEASDAKTVSDYTSRLLSGRSGDLETIRAFDPIFRYGDEKKIIERENAYFFRIIADEYIQEDPLGNQIIVDFPNFPVPHHEDWKPITGEQAWAAIIGPLQVAYRKYNGRIPETSQEMRLALSVLPAVEAMMAPNGAFYHVPDGTYGKNPHDISNENNCSMFAALRMLHEALQNGGHAREAALAQQLSQRQLEYFKQEGFDRKEGLFYQGGFYLDGQFFPAKVLAVDCQTWAINALTPAWIDATFGHGTSYRIWERTKERAGFFDQKGILRGVGFTDGHDVHSIEWTCGAILSARLMTEFYKKTEPGWAEELKRDAVTMRYGVEAFRVSGSNGTLAYFYSNKRYFIPWGWWANPIPSMASSAWVLLIDAGFDPFILGGGITKTS